MTHQDQSAVGGLITELTVPRDRPADTGDAMRRLLQAC